MRPDPCSPSAGTAVLCNWWNHPELLDDFVTALSGEAWDELLVVDNASEPETAALLRERIEGIGGQVLRREKNGQLDGLEASIAATRSDVLVFLNNDIQQVRAGWLERLVARVEPGVLCGHQMRAKLGVRYVDGWCLAVLREDWKRLGGYDASFEEPPYWADMELSLRAERLGMELVAVPTGLRHLRNVSIRGFQHAPWFRDLKDRNRARFEAALRSGGDQVAEVDWQIPGINFFGPISGNMGLGVAARNWLRFFLEAGVEVHAVDLLDRSGRSTHAHGFHSICHDPNEPAPHHVNVFAMNPWSLDQLQKDEHASIDRETRVNAIVPFWELERIPEDWRPALDRTDLVIAPTRFIAEAHHAAKLRAEVMYVPQPFEPGEVADRGRSAWGVPEDAFLVVGGFEMASDIERKNPWALIAAFQEAFPRDPSARLLLKLNNARSRSAYLPGLGELERRCSLDPRISLIEGTLPYPEVLALYAMADVYVSMHRAEGLGLGMLESMSVGTPVVATAWSGNLDYMTPDNSCLVDFAWGPVRASTQAAYAERVVGPDARWAEPDVGDAARWLRALAEDPALGRGRRDRALRDLARRKDRTDFSAIAAALQRAADSDGFKARRGRALR